MDIYSKKTDRKAVKSLNEATNTKVWKNTNFISLAILKKESDEFVLYPIPQNQFNALNDKNEPISKMNTYTTNALKLKTFIWTVEAKEELKKKSEAVVLIAYFDIPIGGVVQTYNAHSKDDGKRYNPNSYVSNAATFHKDKWCIILGEVVL